MLLVDTALRVLGSAGLTAVVFALPIGLTGLVRETMPELDLAEELPFEASFAFVPIAVASMDEPAAAAATPEVEPERARAARSGGTATRAAAGTRGSSGPDPTPGAPELGSTGAKVEKSRRDCQVPSEGIRRGDDGVILIDRELVSAYALHPGRLDDLGWVAPHDDASGRNDGFRLGGLRCGTDLHEAGLRSGDVVHAVNGIEITSIPEALLAYARLKKAEDLTVEITRKGARTTLTYRLVG